MVAVALAMTAGVCASGALTGCSSSAAQRQTAGTNFVAGDGTITVLAVGQRRDPVSLAGTTLTGDRLDLAQLRGKPVVLTVWGSWCGPCRKEAPDLQAAYTQLKGSGVAFVGLHHDDTQANATAFQKKFGVTYPSIDDDGGRLLLALRGAVAPQAIPTTVVLDAQGRVAARVSGPTTKATLVGLVENVSAGATPAT
jgi:thiol-disulfide isomerase/thioredoxin